MKAKKPSLMEGKTSWDEVMEEVHSAAKLLPNKSGFWGRIQKSFRSVGKNSDALKAWVRLLPSDSYFSVICGGLRLIVGVSMTTSSSNQSNRFSQPIGGSARAGAQ